MDLPDDLELPLASGAAWWYWLGGRCAIDFVNTQRERWWRNVETLVTAADLALWLTQANLLEHPADVTLAQVRAARRLRTAIDGGTRPSRASAPPPHSTTPPPNNAINTAHHLQRPFHHRSPPTARNGDPRDQSLAGARVVATAPGAHARRRSYPGRTATTRPCPARSRPHRTRRGDPVRHRSARPPADLRVGDVQRPLLRRLSSRDQTLVLHGRLRQHRQGQTPPRPARLPAAADPTRSDVMQEEPGGRRTVWRIAGVSRTAECCESQRFLEDHKQPDLLDAWDDSHRRVSPEQFGDATGV